MRNMCNVVVRDFVVPPGSKSRLRANGSRRKPGIPCTAEASAGASAAESAEQRAGAKGNALQPSTYWTQRQARVTQELELIRQTSAVKHPRWEPYTGKPHVRFWAGRVRGNARPYRY